ncbi:MAG TPA: sialate O-acetylesterase [Planctomycetota bacterium]|nr:sialate O-acetylesterase [Planctomycetota bacterium]
MRPLLRLLSIAATLAAGSSALQAAVAVASPFTDHAVLQRGQPIPVWGTADAGEKITITFDGQTKTVTAGDDKKWVIKLDTHAAGGPYDLTVAGTNTIKLTDILVGEVWVCSGQSNMEFVVKGSRNSAQEIADAKFPKLRHFKVEKKTSDVPLTECKGTWTVCSPETVGGYTAVGYYFGRKLVQELDVPIGLLHTSWGGTPAEAWTGKPALTGAATFSGVFTAWDKQMKGYPAAMATYKETLAKWETDAAAAKIAGKPAPNKPRPPQGQDSPNKPATLYNGMLTPLVPYGIKGAIWYQGESNAGRAKDYRELMALLIGDWRQSFGQGDFPFYVVQLANYMKRSDQPTDTAWAALREAQYLITTTMKNTGMSVTIDIGEGEDIHPKNKQDVGLRLALIALAKDYGKQIEYSGPIYKSLAVDGANAVVSFDHLGGGLSVTGDKLTGFAIAGEDKKFVWADAKIVGDTVVLSAAGVTKPVAVHYAWGDNPECSLSNKAGLPAVPFRTDRP